jgi:hypothetical protein
MNADRESLQTCFRMFDDALGLHFPAAGEQAPVSSAGEILREMVRRPVSWEYLAEALRDEQAWDCAEDLPPADLPETMVLGLMLCLNSGGLAEPAPASAKAAAFWYRSALVLEAREPLTVSALRYFPQVLRPIGDRAAASGQGMDFALMLELAFERAVQDIRSTGAEPPRSVRQGHARVLQDLVWTILQSASPAEAFDLAIRAWVAGDLDEVLQTALQHVSAGDAEGRPGCFGGLDLPRLTATVGLLSRRGVRLAPSALCGLDRAARDALAGEAAPGEAFERVELIHAMAELLANPLTGVRR